jgi:cytochrome P450
VTARVPRASAADSAGFMLDVAMPLMARGVIVRRPPVVGLLDRADADRRAVRRMQKLRARYGPGPLLLRAPGREIAVVLSPEHVHRVLAESPDPFTPANREKRGALSHFQPHGVLISPNLERPGRRRFNEEVLDTDQPVHRLADVLTTRVREEADGMLDAARRAGSLDWDRFATGWWRLVRRVVLGDAARDDETVTDLLTKLRGDANWAYLKPTRKRLRARFLAELRRHLERAEPGSLAQLVAGTPSQPETFPVEQVPQWLFAFDAAGMASLRALALLDAHQEQTQHDPAFLRAALLESVRLWPTTPAVLRDTTRETHWGTGSLPAGAAVVVFAPFFHRDDENLPEADRFAPQLWLDGAERRDWPLIPFSEGPVVCAGQNLVLLVTSNLLARLLAAEPRGIDNPLSAERPLPRTLSPFRLRFAVR